MRVCFLLGSSRRFGSIGSVSVRDSSSLPLLEVFIAPAGAIPSQQLSDTKTFAPVSAVGGSLTGFAAFGLIDSFPENFSEVVPEPATFLLLGSAFAGLAFLRPKFTGADSLMTRQAQK